MRLDKDCGSSSTPELLLIEFHHFLVMASDALDLIMWIFGIGISTLLSS